jgi:hypothetical protein
MYNIKKIIYWLKNIFKKQKVEKRFISDYEFNSIRKDKQDRLDKILDKISEKGYSSLTKKEFEFLSKKN